MCAVNLSTGAQFATLASQIALGGVGLHSGAEVTVTLRPRSASGPGLVFARTDLPGSPRLAADDQFVSSTTHATTLTQGNASVSTTEHLLAALWALDITHCDIEIDGPEVPILDGSALPWVHLIQEAGYRALDGLRPVYSLIEPVWIQAGEACVLGLPHPEFRLTASVDYGVPHAGAQTADLPVNAASFASELAGARTFTLERWLEPLRAAGLIRGGSELNAILLREDGTPPPLRFPDELARHKALDVVGDLALLFAPRGARFQGHVIAIKAGHGPHRQWIEACLASGLLHIT